MFPCLVLDSQVLHSATQEPENYGKGKPFSQPVSQGHWHSLNPKLCFSYWDPKGSLWEMRSFETGQDQKWHLCVFTGNIIITLQRETHKPVKQTLFSGFTRDIFQYRGCETLRQITEPSRLCMADWPGTCRGCQEQGQDHKAKIEKLQNHSEGIKQELKIWGDLWKKKHWSRAREHIRSQGLSGGASILFQTFWIMSKNTLRSARAFF